MTEVAKPAQTTAPVSGEAAAQAAPPPGPAATPIPVGQVEWLLATASRAPSIHNTQPWRFRVGEYAIELYADPGRKLRMDPLGREMLISCGAALFGLRLAVRSLGYLPIVELLHRLLAHAASKWVFASLHTQLLESAAIRALIRDRLALPGAPQMLL